jgi:hypothetical protein
MANTNGWGDGAANNTIGWGQGANNAIGWGDIQADSWAGLTDITGVPGFDADAQAFFTAANITDATQKTAVNQLVLDLKSYSLWTKLDCIYPMVGGTSTTHSYNLKNTATFQITFNGGVTHSSNGVQFGGVNGYGNTNFNPSTNGSQNSHHQSFYSRTNVSAVEIETGGTDASSGSYVAARLSGISYFRLNALTDISIANANSQGFYIGNRTASNVVNGWKNGTKVVSGTVASTGNPNAVLFIGAWNNVPNPGIRYYSSKQCAFASIGTGLTDTEAGTLRTAVQTFNTTLGRNV